MGVDTPLRQFKDRVFLKRIKNLGATPECTRSIKPIYCENTERKIRR